MASGAAHHQRTFSTLLRPQVAQGSLRTSLPQPRRPYQFQQYQQQQQTHPNARQLRTHADRRLEMLEKEAMREGSDANAQGAYLSALNDAGQPLRVITLFEQMRVQPHDTVLAEYLRALVNTERLDKAALLQTVSRGMQAQLGLGPQAASPASMMTGSAGGRGASSAAGAGVAGSAQALTEGGRGSASEPLHMTMVEPSLRTQIWRSIRTILTIFVGVSAVGALLEDRGMTRSLGMNKDETKPVMNTSTRFSDVQGVEEAKRELQEVVEYLRNPEKFTRLGGKLPKGVLLVGPPGTGKTMLARAIAGEAGVPFFYGSGSEFEEMFVGVGARRVRDLFAAAKRSRPCIVFIDEIDAIGSARTGREQQAMKMTLNQLLVELDGFKQNEGIIVVAATNFPESLDKALVRAGRFDTQVVVPNPDLKGRKQILESYGRKVPLDDDVDLEVIARGTVGFSGADLANLINVAALRAAIESAQTVTHKALEYAKDKITMGVERKSAYLTAEALKLTAYHEGGHALVALLTDGSMPIHKATIVPRGPALGMVMMLPEKDQMNMTLNQLKAQLDVAMGGRVAEEIIFGPGEVTTGAQGDFQNASKMARNMVTKYGMSNLGVVQHQLDDITTMSTETREHIEKEVKALVTDAYERAKKLLLKHEKELHLLAGELLKKETLTGDEIRELLKGVLEQKRLGRGLDNSKRVLES